MALGDTLRRIVASDNFILNAAGALVGIKNPNANGLDLRVDQPAAYLPSILAQSGAPLILPSSGSSNDSGQITLATALPYQPQGTVQVYLPAGVIVGDATGGMKSAVFSSTTVCRLAGNPATANSAYTQTTAEVNLATVSVPGGSMGANGQLRITEEWSYPSSANTKIPRVRFGGAIFYDPSLTTSVAFSGQARIWNRNSQSVQIGNAIAGSTGGWGATANARLLGAVDTTAPQSAVISAQIASASEYMLLEAFVIEVLPAS